MLQDEELPTFRLRQAILSLVMGSSQQRWCHPRAEQRFSRLAGRRIGWAEGVAGENNPVSGLRYAN